MVYRLPERKKDDQLDSSNFQERLVLSQVVLQLDIELYQAIHGYRDAGGINDHNLKILVWTPQYLKV